MAKVIGPCLSLDARGTIGKLGTFQRRISGNAVYLRNFPGGREPFSPSPAQLAQRSVIGSLVASWKVLDRNYKDQWDDLARETGEVGTGYHLYVKSGGAFPTMVDGLYFNSLSLGITGPITASNLIGSGDFTMEGWVKMNTTQTGLNIPLMFGKYPRYIYINWRGGTTYRLLLTDSVNTAYGEWAGFPTNVWGHLVSRRTGGLACLFFNGVKKSDINVSAVGAVDAVGGIFEIHDWGLTGFKMRAEMAEVRLWNVALDSEDIKTHSKQFRSLDCSHTSGASSANLIRYYKMSEGSGIKLFDSSGKGNTAIFSGAPYPNWVQRNLFKDIYGLT